VVLFPLLDANNQLGLGVKMCVSASDNANDAMQMEQEANSKLSDTEHEVKNPDQAALGSDETLEGGFKFQCRVRLISFGRICPHYCSSVYQDWYIGGKVSGEQYEPWQMEILEEDGEWRVATLYRK